MKDHESMPLDFESWSRKNLVKLVQDLWAQNKELRQTNKRVLEAWRKELARTV